MQHRKLRVRAVWLEGGMPLPTREAAMPIINPLMFYLKGFHHIISAMMMLENN